MRGTLRNVRSAHILIQALGFGLFFGLLEGIEINLFRFVPTLLAHEKVSADILWVTPLVHLALNIALALVLMVSTRFLSRLGPSVTASLFVFFGVIPLVHYPRRIQWWGMLVLSAGIAVVVHRVINLREEKLYSILRRSILPSATLIVLFAVGLPVGRRVSEKVRTSQLPQIAPESPDILLIVLDTVRADHMSCYGYDRPTTPFLNEWVRQTTLFENAYSPSSWSLSSHATVLTGRYLHEGAPDWSKPVVPKDHLQIQEVLLERGYATGSFSANKIFVTPEHGFGRGFLHNDPYSLRILVSRTVYGHMVGRILRKLGFELARDTSGEVILQRFLDWQKDQVGRPYFAFLNFMDAHEPFRPPAPFDRRFANDRVSLRTWSEAREGSKNAERTLIAGYDGGIAYLDSLLQRLFAALDRRGRMENTLVVILSDHGEALGRDGIYEHGLHLHREQIHIPLILRLPGKVPQGLRVSGAVSGADVPSTIAELASIPATRMVPGASLSLFWIESPNAPTTDALVISELTTSGGKPHMATAITSESQYIINLRKREELLYDLVKDPEAIENLARKPHALPMLQQFRTKLDERYRAFPDWQPSRAMGLQRVP